MRIACLGYEDGPTLKATAAGRQSWIKWLGKEPSEPIQMRITPGVNKSADLPDFTETSTGSIALSKRACEFVGTAAFEMISDLQIEGVTGYVLGWSWRIDPFLEKDGKYFIDPLRTPVGAIPPHGMFLEPESPFSGLKGDIFMTMETWTRIEAAGLTGLVRLGVYEVAES